jgi:prepilin-type N-terminal cleavage/methylation domain-containing protein
MGILKHFCLKNRVDATHTALAPFPLLSSSLLTGEGWGESENVVRLRTAHINRSSGASLRLFHHRSQLTLTPTLSGQGRGTRQTRRTGFTLVELLVALTILALMSMMSWRGLDTVLRSRDAAIASRDKVNRLANTLEQMSADVRSATSGRSAAPIVLGATGFAMERELAQAAGPARRATVQWQFSNNALIRTVVAQTAEQSSALTVLPNVRSWEVAVFVNGNWLPGAEWLKQQEERLRAAQSPVPQPQAGIIAGGIASANTNKILALSVKLSMPEGDVTKILLTESL